MVRGRGYLKSVGDIEQVGVSASEPARRSASRDVAQVALGPDLRRGVAELDGQGEVPSAASSSCGSARTR